MSKNNERLSFFHKIKSEHPNSYRKEFEDDIERGVIVLGMTPFEAKLAGGAFYYKVQADSAVWKEHADPMQVMWAQSNNPDNSEIEMTFQNMTQNNSCLTNFKVLFKDGMASSIEFI